MSIYSKIIYIIVMITLYQEEGEQYQILFTKKYMILKMKILILIIMMILVILMMGIISLMKTDLIC